MQRNSEVRLLFEVSPGSTHDDFRIPVSAFEDLELSGFPGNISPDSGRLKVEMRGNKDALHVAILTAALKQINGHIENNTVISMTKTINNKTSICARALAAEIYDQIQS